MKSYEIFTDKYSVIIQALSVIGAAEIFVYKHSMSDEIKCIVETKYRDEQFRQAAVSSWPA